MSSAEILPAESTVEILVIDLLLRFEKFGALFIGAWELVGVACFDMLLHSS